jgi:hypothetical protein
MKKVSTVAAKPSKKISQQKLTVGLDLGDRNSWYCVLDESGHAVLEQRVSTTTKAMQEAFSAVPRSRIALRCEHQTAGAPERVPSFGQRWLGKAAHRFTSPEAVYGRFRI